MDKLPGAGMSVGGGGVPPQLDGEAVLRRLRLLERRYTELMDMGASGWSALAFVSHELRTPLTGVIGFSELLQDDDIATDEDARHQYLEYIFHSGERLLSFLNRMLLFSRVEAGRHRPSPEAVALLAVAEKVAATSMAGDQDTGKGAIVEIAPELPLVQADPALLEEIFVQLLENAHRAAPEGRVVIRAAVEADREGGGSSGHWGKVVVRVIDDGPGIPLEAQARALLPFRRVDEGPERDQSGIGMGLTLAEALARAQGGRLWLEESQGGGCTVAFSLPVDGQTSEGRTHPEKEPAGAQVIVALADTSLRDATVAWLQEQGCQSKIVADGTEALNCVRREAPLALLCDQALPTMNGWQLVGALRADPERSGCPVALVSPHAGDELLWLADPHGPTAQLPVSVGSAAWQRWLQSSRLEPMGAPKVLALVASGGAWASSLQRSLGAGTLVLSFPQAADLARVLSEIEPSFVVWQPTPEDPTGHSLLKSLAQSPAPVLLLGEPEGAGLLELADESRTSCWDLAEVSEARLASWALAGGLSDE